MRQRKTEDEWTIQGNYCNGNGWEDLCCETSWKDARNNVRLYRQEEPGVVFRVKRKRVPKRTA